MKHKFYNPEKITHFYHTNGNCVKLGKNQSFQAFYNDKKDKSRITKLEIWEELPDGRLRKIIGFNGKSILMIFTKGGN